MVVGTWSDAYKRIEYHQGNGINETSHRILETAIQSHYYGLQGSAENMVADAVIINNVAPNRNIGDTRSSIIFGCDLHIPGLEEFEPDNNEESRLNKILNFRGYKLLAAQLQEIDEFKPTLTSHQTWKRLVELILGRYTEHPEEDIPMRRLRSLDANIIRRFQQNRQEGLGYNIEDNEPKNQRP